MRNCMGCWGFGAILLLQVVFLRAFFFLFRSVRVLCKTLPCRTWRIR